MDQKRLLKTIETVAAKNFDTDQELLEEVVNQIVYSKRLFVKS